MVPASARTCSVSASAVWLAASTPASGSSRMSTRAPPASPRATRARRCWPPDNRLTGRPRCPVRPTTSIAASTARRSSPRARRHHPFAARRPERTSSSTVTGIGPAALCRCGTYPIVDRSATCRGRPNHSTLPPSTSTSPSMPLTSVDFPEPLGPSTATTSPASISRSARAASWLPYPNRPSRTLIAAVGMAGAGLDAVTRTPAPSAASPGWRASPRSSRRRPIRRSGLRADRAPPFRRPSRQATVSAIDGSTRVS